MTFKPQFLVLLFALVSLLYLYLSRPSSSLSGGLQSHPFLTPPAPLAPQITPLHDISSLSNINEVRTLHYHLDLSLDFDAQIVSGTNTLTLSSLIPNLTEVHLDVRNLSILEVIDEATGRNLQFRIENNPFGDESIGDQLRVFLRRTPELFRPFKISIRYKTTPTATALNWLTKEQTSSKTQPYLFSQCESIHCRTVAPLQDTPAIKSTYSANVTVPSDITVFMSANMTNKYSNPASAETTFEFHCAIPIPSYLLAIVAGNVTQQQIGPRTFVITEPNDLPAFSKELEDLETYLSTVEEYITPYAWGYYKIVILPPSFPYGGMENPLLTFASPSIIAGDKSGVFVAIHEIGHSWTGNWVTCQNWENFWINEGFCVFLERKACHNLFGYNYYAIYSIVGNDSYLDDMKSYGFNDSYSSLHPALTGRNPDDAFSTVPYEKGFQFLVYLESLVGPLGFQSFLRSYIDKFAKGSPVYEEVAEFFTAFVVENLENSTEILSQVDWKAWIWQPGMPPVDMSPFFRNTVLGEAEALAQQFIDGQGLSTPNNSEIYKGFDMNLKLLFLQYFVDRVGNVSISLIDLMNQVYGLNNNTNFEVGFVWWRLNVMADNQKVFDLVEKYLGKTGRMKFVRPLFVALNEKHHDLAVQIFRKYEAFYHPIAVRLIKQDLNVE